MQLHQPNWRKYLSLKPDRNILRDDSHFVNGTQSSSYVAIEEPPGPSPPTKKRKRTEEEIARRKEKKLRSKANESREWISLSNGDAVEPSSNPEDGDSNEKPIVSVSESAADTHTKQKSSDALFSSKAKEIAKARREEKRKEKSTPKKVSQKGDNTNGSDKKTNEVIEYLKEYDAHVKEGKEWKFKKQHQNWILKNLYNYAWKSDELVYEYLKTIQGQARERLVAGAKEVTEAAEGKHGEDALRRAQAILKL